MVRSMLGAIKMDEGLQTETDHTVVMMREQCYKVQAKREKEKKA